MTAPVDAERRARALAALTPDELEVFEERAGIMEHDGQLPLAEAERAAYARVMLARRGQR